MYIQREKKVQESKNIILARQKNHSNELEYSYYCYSYNTQKHEK
jgi:hypothetical protein